MNKESLEKARNLIVFGLDRIQMDQMDKVELMKNLLTFLDDDNYEHDRDLLQRLGNPKDKQRQAGQGPQKVLRRTVGDDSGER